MLTPTVPRCFRLLAVAVGCTLAAAVLNAQTATVTAQPAANGTHRTRHTAHRRVSTPRRTATARIQTIPIETAPARPNEAQTQATALTAEQQRVADQQLLQQQQQRSAREAQITNQQVRQAEQRQNRVQDQVRIQDAPGPAQTGVVPAAGPPVAPAATDQRIQDAPGPQPTEIPSTTPTQPSNPPQI